MKVILAKIRAYLDQSGWSVLDVLDKQSGRKFCAVGVVRIKDRLCEGMEYELSGVWKQHPTYGMQFAFDGLRRCAPKTETQVMRYLTKYCHGIGEKAAAAIWLRYGTDSIAALRERPAEVATAIPRLSLAVAMRCSESLRSREATEDARAHLLEIFAGLRIADAVVEECLKTWGLTAGEVISYDPYVMLDAGIERVGFRTADNVYLKLGKDPLGLVRQIRCLLFTLHASNGSTWIAEHALQQEWQRNLGDPRVLHSDTPPAFAEVLTHCESHEMIVRRSGCVALAAVHQMEVSIAQHLRRIAGTGRRSIKVAGKRRFAI